MNFSEFLSNEDFSQAGQIAQYEKSLERLNKAKLSLSRNGMGTADIDNQMDQIHQALQKRRSGTHKWHGAIVRIDQETLSGHSMWRLMTRSGTVFHIPVSEAYGVIKIPSNWQNLKKHLNKFIEYKEEPFGHQVINLITYAENRTVDIVPFRADTQEYYLIQRRDSGMWATVGGHIEEGELDNPIAAARRELQEETGAYPMVIRQLPCGWLRETISNPQLTPAKEFNSWSLPYIALVHPDTEMHPQDDAIGGRFFPIDHIPSELHFSFHKKVIGNAIEFLPTLLKQFGKH